MNKLTAELFLDLIADPAKYRVYLERIEEERKRLEEVVATVGKASELDALRKQVEQEQLDGKVALETKVKEAEMRLDLKFKVAADAQKAADDAQEVAKTLMKDAEEKEKQALALAASFEGRDKALLKQETQVANQRAELQKLVTEYNDKVAKLRAVMA